MKFLIRRGVALSVPNGREVAVYRHKHAAVSLAAATIGTQRRGLLIDHLLLALHKGLVLVKDGRARRRVLLRHC